MNKTILKSLALLATSTLLLAGCGEPRKDEVPVEPTPEAKVFVSAPLTGETLEEGSAGSETFGLPSVACKIDNVEAARPQFNLNKTDIVFVEMVEFGLTRLVAVWQSQPVDQAGPVRSVRPMDADITAPLAGIFCFSGGQLPFVNAVKETGQYMASETSEQADNLGSFSRLSTRQAPHNVMVDVGLLQSQHLDKKAPQPMLTMVAFDPETESYEIASTEAGEETLSFTVKYPQAISSWKPEGNYWVRTQDGDQHIDAATDEILRATNVVVLKTKVDNSFIDKKYGPIPRTVMIDSGVAWVFSNGKRVKGTWTKSSQSAPIQLVDEAGAPIKLAVGNTWVELMAGPSKITIESPKAPSPSPTEDE
ncbi:unannotated protein [freshwater metagenome]|uniref:Unannotated protein n=1 Tax=freshwater metagenome TaxID=449393 RepID=A0A6J6IRI7_9ZZZZ|nr:DUF3048 domain-containing protein [Actinomycetota bacterium]